MLTAGFLSAAVILFIIAAAGFSSGQSDGFPVGATCILLAVICIFFAVSSSYISQPGGNFGLNENSVVEVVWTQQNPNDKRFLAVIKMPDNNYQFFSLAKQPPTGISKVVIDGAGVKTLAPFPEKPQAEQTPQPAVALSDSGKLVIQPPATP